MESSRREHVRNRGSMPAKNTNPETVRLREARYANTPWKKWGPYLSERQWGTVREDYSQDGNAWDYFSSRSGPIARLSLG